MANLRIALCLLVAAACGPGNRGNLDGQGSNSCGTIPNACSADLMSVVDCNGTVVASCPAGDCANATCGTSACEAAAANKDSIGCDYYAVDPDIISDGYGGCYAAFVANTSGAPVTISVSRNGQDLPIAAYARVPFGQGQALTYTPLTNNVLNPDQVAILFLARFGSLLTNCPAGVTPAYTTADAAFHGTGYGEAFHIKTSAPVVAYDIFPYGGGAAAATSATLLIPTSAWDLNYVGVDAYRKSVQSPTAQPFIEIVGSADATHVTIRPTVPIVGGAGVAAGAQGVPSTYVVGAGQVLQFTQDAELVGSVINADKPIGLWGGATCLSIDIDKMACDSAHQNIPPVNALGNRYAAVRYRNRFAGQEETVPWRIVGAADGTTLTYTPSTPPGAPTTLALGQLVEFQSPGQFVVQSQDANHPFYMSAHMTGCQTVNPALTDCRGDPEFVNVIPPEQYLNKYTFFTDPTYPETNLVLVREQKNGVFSDVNVDCAGTVTGWTPIDAGDTIEYARLDMVTGNFQSVNGCNNGVHVATSVEPFGLVVWGWGSSATLASGFNSITVSYAYPAGASVKPINTVVIQ